MRINSALAWTLVATVAIAVIALAVNFQLAFTIAFFSILGLWAWLHPLPAFFLLVVTAPLLPMFKITQTIGTITLLKDVLICVLFIKLFLIPLLTKHLAYRPNIVFAPLVALAMWTFVNITQADSLILGLLRARDIGLYVLLYMATLYLPRKNDWYREATEWFFVSALIVGVLGYYQLALLPESAVLRFDPAREIWIPRVSSIMAHPSILGEYLVAVSALLLALLLFIRRQAALATGVLLMFLAPLVYFTYSRAVWMGYVAGLAAVGATYLWGRWRQKQAGPLPWKTVATSLGALVIFGFLVVQFTRVGIFVRSAFDPTYASNAERLEFLVRLVAPLTPRQALFGAGLGDVTIQNFRQINVTAFDVTSGASRAVQLAKNATLVDNQYLKTFVEMGLTGLIIYAWLYWRVFVGALRLVFRRETGRPEFSIFNFQFSKIIGLWGLGFLASFLVQAFFIDIWDIFPTNMAFWVVAALVSREQTPYTDKDGEG